MGKSQFVARTPFLVFAIGFVGFTVLVLLPQRPCGCLPSRSGTTVRQMRELAKAVDLFEKEHGRYPTSVEGLRALQSRPSDIPRERWLASGHIDASFSLEDPWGTEILYRANDDPSLSPFELWSAGPDRAFDTGDDFYRFAEPTRAAPGR